MKVSTSHIVTVAAIVLVMPLAVYAQQVSVQMDSSAGGNNQMVMQALSQFLGGMGMKLKAPTHHAGPITPDSLNTLEKLVRAKNSVVVIDGAVSSMKVLDTLSVSQISSVDAAVQPSDVKTYGNQAKNGVIRVVTQEKADADAAKAGTPAPAAVSGAGSGQVGGLQVQTH